MSDHENRLIRLSADLVRLDTAHKLLQQVDGRALEHDTAASFGNAVANVNHWKQKAAFDLTRLGKPPEDFDVVTRPYAPGPESSEASS